MNKASIPQGMRDFGPETVRKRNHIFSTIRSVFELYGFQPLETPAMENLETLMGKYGEEGDKLMFKVLNNGLNDPKNSAKAEHAFSNVLQGRSDKNLTERALKYDLTIPFARFVAMNAGQLSFPFKRYQIQPVWRADRPQKGRYREFYQCDADIVGSRSLINELEFCQIYAEVFSLLKLSGCRILINNRKVLKAIMQVCEVQDWEKKVLVIIDKTDKIGVEGVRQELAAAGIPEERINKLLSVYTFQGNNAAVVHFLRELFEGNEGGNTGLSELENLVAAFTQHTAQTGRAELVIDLTLARGLDYYTGVIFEVRAPAQVKIGSIGGGGRYDDLTGLFGVPDVPGAGISFGVDRIYDVLEELGLFPADIQIGANVLFFNKGITLTSPVFDLAQQLREAKISCEVFPESVKIDKQLKYALRKNIPFAVSFEEGSEEVVIENLIAREKRRVTAKELVPVMSNLLK